MIVKEDFEHIYDKSSTSYKRGKFTLSGHVIRSNNYAGLSAIMNKVIVYHVNPRFDNDTITYYAYHPDFDEITLGEKCPEYTAEVSKTKNGYEVEWKRK